MVQSAETQPLQPASSLTAPATEHAPVPVRRRRPPGSGRRSWRRRLAWWIPLGILMAIALAGGGTAWRVREAFQTLNSASTPAPSLSGEALGGDASVVIDTGPARTALALADASRTPTPAEGAAGATETTAPDGSTATPTGEDASTAPDGTGGAVEPTAVATGTAVAPEEGRAETPAATSVETADAEGTGETAEADETAETAESGGAGDTPAAIVTSETDAGNQGDDETSGATATSEPAAEPTESTEPATVTATAEPVLSEVERIKDGGFEEEPTVWYVEDGAGPVVVEDAHGGERVMELPATGAFVGQSIFFLPGTTYRLSGWVRLTGEGDEGEVGVVYRNEAGERLADAEPAPVRVDGTEFTEVSFDFTPPEGTTKVEISLYKRAGTASMQADDLSVRSVVPPALIGAAVDAPADDGTITLLFMGVDARPGEEIDINVRPDSLMVVHLNPESRSCRVLSVPRDTRAELEGYGPTKINHALAVGGIDFQVQTVSDLLGVPIDHYVLIDFNGFEDLVDAVGGVEIDVPEAFTTSGGVSFAAGPQTMDGETALAYARDRSGPEGDFGRIERQQQIIRALVARSIGLDIVTSIGDLLPAVEQNVRTDLAVTDMVSIASTYRSICSEEAITLLRLEGELATFDDPLLGVPLSYVVVDEAEIRRKVAALLEP